MLKRMTVRKIFVATLALFVMGLIYLMPDYDKLEYPLSQSDVEYVYTNAMETIYLLDKNDYVARTTMKGCDCDTLDYARDVIKGLIIDGEKSNQIPNGFRSLIPSGTEILNLDLKDKILTINFSRELLDINEKYEEAMIEAIIYSLTSIEGIDQVIIQVEGNVLTELPHSKKILPSSLDRNYGINKSYDLINTNDIESITVYYVSDYHDKEYYVPVTKYINKNGNMDKINVIIDELSSSPIYEENLMSYVNSNVALIDYHLDQDILYLNFNDAILNNDVNEHILEEVIYTISYSLLDSCSIKDISFSVEGKEIYKNSLKSLE